MSEQRPARVERFLDWIAPESVQELAQSGELLEGVSEAHWTDEQDVERAKETVDKLAANEPLTQDERSIAEAIILPNERPVVDITGGDYATPPAPFTHLGSEPAHGTIRKVIPSIGRVELPGNLSIPYGGTGFVVGENLLMTNRHVAELFTLGLGREGLEFRPGQSSAVDFLRERDRPASKEFSVERVVMIHPYWDMALLETAGLGDVPVLTLSVAPPDDLNGSDVVVVGYPAMDPRNNVDVQNRVFSGVFNVKRLQPGQLRETRDVESFGHNVRAVTHDSSTLGGNSGSAVIEVASGQVVALHFAGRYLDANFAVPTRELALDRRVADAAVNFDQDISAEATSWDGYWDEADPDSTEGPTRAIAAGLPIEITISIRSGADVGAAAAGGADAVERVVEPFHESDYSNRSGYDEDFLGVKVPMPTVKDEDAISQLADGSHDLRYEHFTVVLNKRRRLAQFTASNVDAALDKKEPEPGKKYDRKTLGGFGKNDSERWFTDPRIPAIDQLPDRFYTNDRGAFDRGHIVRREDVCWGDSYDQVRRANGDTYHVTNCSPQVAGFNQSRLEGIWGELENLVLKQAETERYCVLAGPILEKDDPVFVGKDDVGAVQIPIPRRFWKIVVARSGDELQTFAFLLDQDLSDTHFEGVEFAIDADWRRRMISVAQLDKLIPQITFPAELRHSDQIDAEPGEAVRAAAGGMETVAAPA